VTGYIGKTTNQGREVIGAQAQGEREDQWGEMPGEVVSFDPQKQTATIKPLYKPRHRGEPIDMPDLLEVPVRFPRAGGFAFTFPIKPGDKLALRPQMRSSEVYHAEGGAYPASDTRSFNLSDYEAFLDGGESLTDPIPDFNNDSVEVRHLETGAGFRVNEEGQFMQVGKEGNSYTLIAQALRILATHALDGPPKIAALEICDKLDAMSI
jgi:hypothetical protein